MRQKYSYSIAIALIVGLVLGLFWVHFSKEKTYSVDLIAIKENGWYDINEDAVHYPISNVKIYIDRLIGNDRYDRVAKFRASGGRAIVNLSAGKYEVVFYHDEYWFEWLSLSVPQQLRLVAKLKEL